HLCQERLQPVQQAVALHEDMGQGVEAHADAEDGPAGWPLHPAQCVQGAEQAMHTGAMQPRACDELADAQPFLRHQEQLQNAQALLHGLDSVVWLDLGIHPSQPSYRTKETEWLSRALRM